MYKVMLLGLCCAVMVAQIKCSKSKDGLHKRVENIEKKTGIMLNKFEIIKDTDLRLQDEVRKLQREYDDVMTVIATLKMKENENLVCCEAIQNMHDVCSGLPCGNGGTCTPLAGNDYICECPTGYNGENCELVETEHEDVCSGEPCRNGGICYSIASNNYICECQVGYNGENCELVETETEVVCSGDPCRNGGTCTSIASNYYICKCPVGYNGENCETVETETEDLCSESPCLNDGTCRVNGSDTFICDCISGYSGKICNEFCPWPPALGTPCVAQRWFFASEGECAKSCTDDEYLGSATKEICDLECFEYYEGL